MEPPDPGATDLFFDALDTLPSPPPPDFQDTTSCLSSISPPPPSLRRRRLSSKSSIPAPKTLISPKSIDPSPCSSLLAAKDQPISDQTDAITSTHSSITTSIDHAPESSTRSQPPESLLVSLAGFIIRSIFFQMNLLFKSFSFPIWLVYCSFSLLTDPFGSLRRWREGITGWFWCVFNVFVERVSPLVGGQGKLAVRLAWGCFWSLYVIFVLSGLLVMAFFGGSVLMGRVVEEPVRMTTELNFDYTKASPYALVPLPPCDGVPCDSDCSRQAGILGRAGWRPVPLNHKLQLVISLTLPESDYNRKLGVFQVRAEFLSAKGRVTSSSSQPCMLRFKSSHIRFVESFLKSGTLLAGYFSEKQILRLKLAGFTEGTEPTVCIRVILEQRAEYRPGAGIPEIYAASLKLESELPLLKRILWSWRRTVYIWISMALFVWELFVVLICCRPVIIPRARASGIPPSR